MPQKVALTLASGGAKGFAHIGAIEALEEAGYEITSIAGTSMGALVGGLYAAGGLDKAKEWMYDLTGKKVFSLADFTLSPHALLNGNRLMQALKAQVPDCNIEDLNIPFCAVATDLKEGCEYVFRSGSLYDAIRASISIPMLFRPVEMGDMLLIDGGITNGLPLEHAQRTPGDILVAINLEDYKWEDDQDKPTKAVKAPKSSRLATLSEKLHKGINALSNNYVSMTYDTISILMKRNVELSLRLTPPDLYINIDVGQYGSYDYDQAEAISKLGKEQMKELLKHTHAR